MSLSGESSSRTVNVIQTIDSGNIDQELQDQSYIVTMSSRFLQTNAQLPDNIDSDNIATYIITRDSSLTPTGGSQLTLTITTKSITKSQFDVFGDAGDKGTISTIVSIVGTSSGVRRDFKVSVTNS